MTDHLRIDGVRPHRRNSDRVEIEIGGRDFIVAPEFAHRLGAREGRTLSSPELRELETESDVIAAMDRALLLLSYRPRARTELARRLTRLGFAAAGIDAALERLARLGYLDDAAFARQLARGRVLGSGQSRHRIRSELLRKGVDRSTADEAIEETLASEEVDEEAIIDRAAEKKWRSLAKLDPQTRRRRLYAFLARRGFEAEDIQRAIAKCEELEARS